MRAARTVRAAHLWGLCQFPRKPLLVTLVNRSSSLSVLPKYGSPCAPPYRAMSMLTKSILPSNMSSSGLAVLAPTRTSLPLAIEPADPALV